MTPIAIDLFCGAGGFSEGVIQAGFHIVFSSDLSIDVEKTYTHRHEQLGFVHGVNTYFSRADINELPSENIQSAIQGIDMFNGRVVPQIDVIFGGPPCQGFSRAGRRNQDDPRNRLFREYLRVVNDINPKYVVMENVEGFMDTKMDGYVGLTGHEYPERSLMPEILMNEFSLLGYRTLQPEILDASNYGVPQRRKRAIFIAYLDGQTAPAYPEPTTPNEEDKVNVFDAISDLIVDTNIKEGTFRSHSQYQLESINGRTMSLANNTISSNGHVYNHDLSNHGPLIVERFSLFREGESSPMLKKRIKDNGLEIIEYPHLLEESKSALKNIFSTEQIISGFATPPVSSQLIESILTKKNNRFRYNRHRVSPTVVTLPDDFLSPFENRIPSVRELARLQSFDDSFEFLGKRTTGGMRRGLEVPQYSQVGNAIPPLLARAIAIEIRNALEN
ncbi:DNA cytosine methyltransferase [Planococcus halocryophilus]|uniref:DNA cytosine methyltransferase n=1 Tax=Planococcus halocryophilus TaxID=1215089 RepID=UPI001F0E03BE|nr:DNA cytosine methyltransferase [Planococcus halocryophilus]MCH4826644.1 DNA cytosine methyltransferase [Planococcus halocryophilus]